MKIQYFAYLIILLFFAMDIIIRKDNTAKSLSKTKEDNNSTKLIILTFLIILFSAEILTFFIHYGQFDNVILSVIAVIIMVIGLSIRIYSMRKLNTSYTRILQTTEQQKLHTGGLYKIIRHPGYLGTILIWISFGFAIENYIVLFIAIPMTFISYTYRIKSEEKMLLNQFGQEYADYKKKSWRLIPYIW